MIEIGEAAAAWDAGDRGAGFDALCRGSGFGTEELCEQISALLVRERILELSREVGREQLDAALIRAARAKDRVAVHALLPGFGEHARARDRQKLVLLDVPDPVLLRWLMVWYRRQPALDKVGAYLRYFGCEWSQGVLEWCKRNEPGPSRRYPLEFAQGHGWYRPSDAEQLAHERDVEALRKRFEAMPERKRTRALFEAVIADPDDDGARAVLGDQLLALNHQDPRGELIALQLRAAAGPVPDSARERERELLDVHGFSWVGPLWRRWTDPGSVRFERGFLAAIQVWPVSPGFDHMQYPGDPIWATVEEVDGASWAVVNHPIMRSLRVLGCDNQCARKLLGGPPRPKLERLTVTWHPRSQYRPEAIGDIESEHAAALLEKLDAVPNLTHLGVADRLVGAPSGWRWLWQGARAGLASLRVRVYADASRGLADWIALLQQDQPAPELRFDCEQLLFVLDPRRAPRTLRVTHDVPHWREYDAAGSFATLVRVLAATLEAGLVDRVELDPRIAEPTWLIAQMRRGGLELDPAIVIELGTAP